MGDRLAGKSTIVTGAGQGIGRATALAFAREGARVLAVSRSRAPLESLAEEGHGIEIWPLDVTDAGGVESLARSRRGSVDVLFNCAGYVHDGTILDCAEEDWERSFAVNVTAVFRLCRAFIPRMLEAGGGSIVNVASVASHLKGVPRRFAYGASKAAVIGLTRSIARDFIRSGVRCNAICPGTVDSPSLDSRMHATGRYEEAVKEFTSRQPMGRLGRPEEIAALAVHLASDESAFTTGSIYVADGGATL